MNFKNNKDLNHIHNYQAYFYASKEGQMVAMFAFLKLSWIFRLKAVVVLNWKKVARQKQICVGSDYNFFVFWQLRLFFILKVSSFASLSWELIFGLKSTLQTKLYGHKTLFLCTVVCIKVRTASLLRFWKNHP